MGKSRTPVEFEIGEHHHISKESVLFDASMTPSIILHNPKFPHNVGEIVRACSNFGGKVVLFTGDRVSLEPSKGYRLPREERMKDYKDVLLLNIVPLFIQHLRYISLMDSAKETVIILSSSRDVY